MPARRRRGRVPGGAGRLIRPFARSFPRVGRATVSFASEAFAAAAVTPSKTSSRDRRDRP